MACAKIIILMTSHTAPNIADEGEQLEDKSTAPKSQKKTVKKAIPTKKKKKKMGKKKKSKKKDDDSDEILSTPMFSVEVSKTGIYTLLHRFFFSHPNHSCCGVRVCSGVAIS